MIFHFFSKTSNFFFIWIALIFLIILSYFMAYFIDLIHHAKDFNGIEVIVYGIIINIMNLMIEALLHIAFSNHSFKDIRVSMQKYL